MGLGAAGPLSQAQCRLGAGECWRAGDRRDAVGSISLYTWHDVCCGDGDPSLFP